MPATELKDLRGLEKREEEIAQIMAQDIHMMKYALHVYRMKVRLLKVTKGENRNVQAERLGQYYGLCHQQWNMLNGKRTQLQHMHENGQSSHGFEKTIHDTAIDARVRQMAVNLYKGLGDLERSFVRLMNLIKRQQTIAEKQNPSTVDLIESLLAEERLILQRELKVLTYEEESAIAAEKQTKKEEVQWTPESIRKRIFDILSHARTYVFSNSTDYKNAVPGWKDGFNLTIPAFNYKLNEQMKPYYAKANGYIKADGGFSLRHHQNYFMYSFWQGTDHQGRPAYTSVIVLYTPSEIKFIEWCMDNASKDLIELTSRFTTHYLGKFAGHTPTPKPA